MTAETTGRPNRHPTAGRGTTTAPAPNSRPTARLLAGLLVALAVTVGASGCGAGGQNEEQTVLRVFAAASLTDAFTELAAAFEEQQPDIDIELNLAGSSALRAQILAGAPADVFASASIPVMDEVDEAGLTLDEPQVFASNSLEIAVPVGNPANLTGLGDFERQELFLGLCASGVPCGQLADDLLAEAGVTPTIDTREPDVRALLEKVATAELDGGIVYATDVLAAADRVDGVEIAADFDAAARYPIAALGEGDSPDIGPEFTAFVLSASGRAILADHGFGAP